MLIRNAIVLAGVGLGAVLVVLWLPPQYVLLGTALGAWLVVGVYAWMTRFNRGSLR